MYAKMLIIFITLCINTHNILSEKITSQSTFNEDGPIINIKVLSKSDNKLPTEDIITTTQSHSKINTNKTSHINSSLHTQISAVNKDLLKNDNSTTQSELLTTLDKNNEIDISLIFEINENNQTIKNVTEINDIKITTEFNEDSQSVKYTTELFEYNQTVYENFNNEDLTTYTENKSDEFTTETVYENFNNEDLTTITDKSDEFTTDILQSTYLNLNNVHENNNNTDLSTIIIENQTQKCNKYYIFLINNLYKIKYLLI